MTTEIKERIVKYSKELRLPTFRGEFEVHASEAAKQEASYEEYLLGLMEKEYYTRVENRKKSQIRQAGFPQKHYLHDLQKELLPDNARQKLPLLERLDFIKEGRNVVLAGNPGTGKTHIATGLGIKACQHNYKVLFTTVPQVVYFSIEMWLPFYLIYTPFLEYSMAALTSWLNLSIQSLISPKAW
jgi:DNA replication protein DnaC